MKIYILLSPKSQNIKDIEFFISDFAKFGVNLTPVIINDINIVCGNKNRMFINGCETEMPDAVICAFFGDINRHSLYVAQVFESMGVLCINPASCLTDAADKLKSIIKIRTCLPDVKFPETILYESGLSENILKSIGFPMVVKINGGSMGTGVALAKNRGEAVDISESFSKKYNDSVILQKYIESSAGMDIRFIMCGGRFITAFVRLNSGNFISNVSKGGHIEFFEPEKSLIAQAEKIADILKINLGSVDFLFGPEGDFYFCEANSMPGLNYTRAYINAGRPNPMEAIVQNIKEQIKKREV